LGPSALASAWLLEFLLHRRLLSIGQLRRAFCLSMIVGSF
jgi:hypothetical protein